MKKSKNSSCVMLGRDSAFPTEYLLDKLCDAVDILLHDKDYDGHGWEDFQEAMVQGRKRADHIRKIHCDLEVDSEDVEYVKMVERLMQHTDDYQECVPAEIKVVKLTRDEARNLLLRHRSDIFHKNLPDELMDKLGFKKE